MLNLKMTVTQVRPKIDFKVAGLVYYVMEEQGERCLVHTPTTPCGFEATLDRLEMSEGFLGYPLRQDNIDDLCDALANFTES